jgi:hypothetical protein
MGWLPASTVTASGDPTYVDGRTPVPLKEIVSGLPDELLVISTDPVREPVADGVNVIEIVHVVLIATRLPQVSFTGR